MQLIIIAAIDSKDGLGKNNKLAWSYPQDLHRFKMTTLNHTVVMGRKTWESLPKALPGRRNVVITRNPAKAFADYYKGDTSHEKLPAEFYNNPLHPDIFDSPFQLLEKIFYIGGAEIYKQVINEVDQLLLTRVPGDHNCDAFFPTIPVGFALSSSELNPPLTYELYKRRD
jgi:dihydrofolate reductase